MRSGKFDLAGKNAREALQYVFCVAFIHMLILCLFDLRLLLDWGTAWDKRLSWDAWVSFCRMLIEQSTRKQWPGPKESFVMNRYLLCAAFVTACCCSLGVVPGVGRQ